MRDASVSSGRGKRDGGREDEREAPGRSEQPSGDSEPVEQPVRESPPGDSGGKGNYSAVKASRARHPDKYRIYMRGYMKEWRKKNIKSMR